MLIFNLISKLSAKFWDLSQISLYLDPNIWKIKSLQIILYKALSKAGLQIDALSSASDWLIFKKLAFWLAQSPIYPTSFWKPF